LTPGNARGKGQRPGLKATPGAKGNCPFFVIYPMLEPVFFRTPDDLYHWLDENHSTETELYVGFYKKGSGKKSITYREAADEAMCFGWVDAVMKSLGSDAYMIRFVPRRKDSIWSANNIERFKDMAMEGRIQPAGYEAFNGRKVENTDLYSYENAPVELPKEYDDQFKSNTVAWSNFQQMPAFYQRTALFLVMKPKREETRRRKLEELISDSEAGLRVKELRR